ncbi:hypothetical protein BDDG_07836, partial [Blastomyces dermatitidis ATCC 18188]
SSHIDRSAFTDDSELSVKSLVKNLKNVIMKKLSVSYVTESSVFLSVSSTASFSATPLSVSFSAASQSSTLASVSDSPTSATPVPATSTLTTPGFTASAFVTSSSHFKKMLYRLSESHLSVCILSLFLLTSRTIYYMKIAKDICVFRNENMDVVLFYICRHEA